MEKLNTKKPGFTIIEVVLVLAIAGLIFMMVFIAYPALRRSQRDTQRQHDVSRLVTAIQSYMSSHNGKMPDSVYDGRTYVYGHAKIAYNETKPSSNSWHDFYDRYLLVGDGTSNVVVEGSLYNNGDSVGAEWIKAYITYMCKVKTANFITQGGKFRNNSTYQAILTILRSVVNGFLQFGRLANFVVSAPPFSDLPKTGDTIVINNAWKADYIDQVRSVTVYGTLYIQQPSK
jgi:prepilin-type N-terminal cleavage/methylation domain-containing protein